ncbi:MAG: hypothetical protein JST19_01450 [Bacteroidetes bacterium]|nr:hypothetical protein [Bacteroidota bacterium]
MIKYTFSVAVLFLSVITLASAQKADTTKRTQTIAAAVKDTISKKETAKKDTVKHKKSSLKIGLTYANNAVYLARTDSVATPNYGLGLTYTLKSGIFFTGTVNYIPSRQFDKLDAGELETGYNFEKDNLNGGVSVSKYFASFNSTQVISALDATLGAELSYDLFDVVTPSIHADYALVRSGDGNDILITAGLGHEFEVDTLFTPKDHFSIEPKIELTAGTQHFLSTYYVLKNKGAAQRAQHGNAKGKGANKTTASSNSSTQSTPVTTNANQFQTLAYEFTLPIGYSWKKLGFSFTPAYAVAVHKITDDGTTTSYLPNSSVFYFTLGLSYTL